MTEHKREWKTAERGGIYVYYGTNGTEPAGYVLVVSSNARSKDKFVSILMLGDSSAGTDVLSIRVNGMTKYIHCGMLSYIARERLGDKILEVSPEAMAEVEHEIRRQLGMMDGTDYKALYNELIDKLVKNRAGIVPTGE